MPFASFALLLLNFQSLHPPALLHSHRNKQTNKKILNVTQAQSAQHCSRWLQRDSKAYMKRNLETEKKGLLLLSFRAKSGFHTPHFEHAEINVQFSWDLQKRSKVASLPPS